MKSISPVAIFEGWQRKASGKAGLSYKLLLNKGSKSDFAPFPTPKTNTFG